ncbi:rare lipoprotein A [Neisseria sp. HSC-16F19]|nr:septal ring lytic transglycosylase RlpA family protein [Neisseria sp. HSC-16F19]MCP2039658.1 rare lipoprotein A [Neisseria sp. HSC-16F19]
MTQAKNIFFVSLSLIVGVGTGVMRPAAAETAKLSHPVLHGKKADQTAPAQETPKAKAKSQAAVTPNAAVKAEPLHRSANLSYKVAGKQYQPRRAVAEFTQEGRASWYGDRFHGRKTSSGERYDMHQMTAAHPTLPIPSYVKVTNLKNGKEVVVRINDRGPFHGNRVIDLSRAAANKLGFLQAGVAQVRVEQIVPGKAVKKADKTDKTAPAKAAAVFVDLKQFDKLKDAQNYLAEVSAQLKLTQNSAQADLVKQEDQYVVRLGPFQQEEGAKHAKQALLTSL